MKQNQDRYRFTCEFQQRDFSAPVVVDAAVRPVFLGWSAWGGPQRAELIVNGLEDHLLDLTQLVRCGVIIRDALGEPVWWGYVDEVCVMLDKIEIRSGIGELANRIAVQFTHLTPDQAPGELQQTNFAEDVQSQEVFGVKEKVWVRHNTDAAYAEQWRDQKLAGSAWPGSTLTHREGAGPPQAILHCRGWFQTLGWQSYAYREGYYANQGPGAGSFAFGHSSSARYVGQSFTPGVDCQLKYADFQLRNVGGLTRTINARIHFQDPWYPGAVLAISEPFDPGNLPNNAYAWARFTFTEPFPLIGGRRYWVTLNPNGISSSSYLMLRLDQDMSFTLGDGRYYNQTTDSWNLYPPSDRPDTLFRFTAVSDTGDQIRSITSAGGQFFQRITTLRTGIQTSPYRQGGTTCLHELKELMQLGTDQLRPILASVSPERHLLFYEQPDPQEVDVYLNREGMFQTCHNVPLPFYQPPIGRFAYWVGSNRISLPWDRQRLPACFVARAEFWPETGVVRISSQPDPSAGLG